MATGSAAGIYHGTLAAAAVDTITITKPARQVSVTNRGSTTDIFLTIGDSNTAPATPVVAAAENYVVPKATAITFFVPTQIAGKAPGDVAATNVIVKLISSGTPDYTVAVL